MRAQKGYLASKGIKQDGGGKLTKDEIEELQQWMKEEDDRRR